MEELWNNGNPVDEQTDISEEVFFGSEPAPSYYVGKIENPADLVNKLQSVSQDFRDTGSLVPTSGYAFRTKLIENADDLTTRDKLEESYRNDDHALEQQKTAASIGNSVRDNRAKNGLLLLGGLTILSVARPIVNAFTKRNKS